MCEAVQVNFASFPETPAGKDASTIRKVRGECVENASPLGRDLSPTYLCRSDGEWDLVDGQCACEPGFEPRADSCVGKSGMICMLVRMRCNQVR